MTSALPTSSSSSSSSSVPLLAIDGGGTANSSAGGGGCTNDNHPTPQTTAPFSSLELLATLLSRTANSSTSVGSAVCAVPPPPLQSAPNSFAQSANQTPPFASSDVSVIQQLLRAANPLLNNAFVGDLMVPSALQALLMAGMAQQQQKRMAMKREMTEEEEELALTEEGKGSGDNTPPPQQTDEKMETNKDELKQNNAIFIKTEFGGLEPLQQLANVEEEEGETKPNAQQHNQTQQRRQRVGGSSAKTAEVWRFFTQRPPPEQAATCQICQKTIKATNSSTTGMIRHLRSCHLSEFQQLQQARYLKNLKNDAAQRQRVLLQLQIGIDPHSEASIDAIQAVVESSFNSLQSPPQATNCGGGVSSKHSVEALINGEMRSTSPNSTAQQRQLLEQIENFKTSRPTSMERSKKEGGGGTTDPTMVVVVGKRGANELVAVGVNESTDGTASPMSAPLLGTVTKRRKVLMGGIGDAFCARGTMPSPTAVVGGSTTGGDFHQTTPKTTGGKKNGGANGRRTIAAMPPPSSGGGGAAKVIDQHQSDRISEQIAAMVLVDQTEFLLERVGFRQFVQSLVPGYSMPSSGQFRAEIIPRVAKQLHQLALFREELQRNNPFGLPPIGMFLNNNNNNNVKLPMQFLHHHPSQHLFAGGSPTALSTSSSSSSGTPSGHALTTNQTMASLISPSSSTEESGFHEEEQHNISAFGNSNISGSNGGIASGGGGMGLDELVQQAAFHSQNISRSFTFSIDLNSDGSAESVGEKASGKEEDSDTTSSM